MAEPHDGEENYPPPVHDRNDTPVSEDAAERIEQAKQAARQRRRDLGLPDLPAEERQAPKRGKASGKRWKKHGQFMKQGSK
jgi:hypothetical protein